MLQHVLDVFAEGKRELGHHVVYAVVADYVVSAAQTEEDGDLVLIF